MFSRLLVATALTLASGIVDKARAQCLHSGTLPGSQTWDPSCVHVINQHLTIGVNDTLRILAGTIVKIVDYRSLIVNGTLLASGTEGSSVHITSYHDDTVGGDTNMNGAATVPGLTLRWQSIQFLSQSRGQLEHCEVRWGGRAAGGGAGDYRPMVDLQASGTVLIANSVLERTQSDIVRCQGGARPLLDSTTLQLGGGAAIEVDASSLVPTCVNLSIVSNAINGIEVPGGSLSANAALSNMGITYAITQSLTIGAGRTLELLAGTIVKVADYRALLVDGTLLASGTSGSPIHITSLHDDTAGIPGDTNGNGGGTVPGGVLRWQSILFRSQSTGQLDHCEVRWGGRAAGGGTTDYRPMVDLQASGSVAITNSVLERTQSDIVRCQGGARPFLSNITFQNGGGAAIEVDASSLVPTCVNLSIASNAINGIEVPGGSLSANAALSNMGVTYAITQNLTIGAGRTLELLAGTIVKVADYRALLVDGTLLASGTSGSPIHITSLHDDTIGIPGDTNGNGGGTVPGGVLRWQSILFRSQSTGQLDHCEVRWGGRAAGGGTIDYRPMVDFQASGSVGITNSVLERTQSDIVRCQDGARPLLDSTTLQFGGGAAIEVDASSLVPKCVNLSIASNAINGIEIPGGTVSANAALPNMGVTYAITQNLTIGAGHTLELFAKTVVKVADYRALLVDGTLWAHGWSPIYITSLRDDTVGIPGDTNGDGGGSVPGGTLRWQNIQFRSQGHAKLSRVWVRWGGRSAGGGSIDYRPMIQFTGSGDVGEIVDSNISDYQQAGIDVASSVSQLKIDGCNLSGDNTQYALQYVGGGANVAALNNWWGNASGPLDSSAGPPDHNPTGTGRRVSDFVEYRPWRTIPVTPTSTLEEQNVGQAPMPVFLYQNAPNPFNPKTLIRFDLGRAGRVKIEIYAAGGALVRTLLDRELEPRRHEVEWDGLDEAGRRVASGTYFYQIVVGDLRQTRKMVILK